MNVYQVNSSGVLVLTAKYAMDDANDCGCLTGAWGSKHAWMHEI